MNYFCYIFLKLLIFKNGEKWQRKKGLFFFKIVLTFIEYCLSKNNNTRQKKVILIGFFCYQKFLKRQQWTICFELQFELCLGRVRSFSFIMSVWYWGQRVHSCLYSFSFRVSRFFKPSDSYSKNSSAVMEF